MNADEREALADIIDGCIPDDIPGYRQRYTDKAAEAILAAGFRRQGPVIDAMVEVASRAFGGMTSARWADAADWERDEVRDGMRRALRAVRDAS
jgi:hypothetical protein